MRITEEQRGQIEDRIRAASDRLLRGEIPPGGGCDVKTLATEAGVTRAALYSTYLHLKEEFEARRERMREAGQIADPRLAQIERLKTDNAKLRERVAARDHTVVELEAFRTTAVSRLAAQHEEIVRLRHALSSQGNVRALSTGRAPHPADGQRAASGPVTARAACTVAQQFVQKVRAALDAVQPHRPGP